MATRGFRSRDVIGRTIVGVELNRFSDGKGGWAFDPFFLLDNGGRLAFYVQETDTGEYGIGPVYRAPLQGTTVESETPFSPTDVRALTPAEVEAIRTTAIHTLAMQEDRERRYLAHRFYTGPAEPTEAERLAHDILCLLATFTPDA